MKNSNFYLLQKKLIILSVVLIFPLFSVQKSATAQVAILKIKDIVITSPSDGTKIKNKPVRVKGEISYQGDFESEYTIALYKLIGGSFYWQKSGTVVRGKWWKGIVWPQETGFSGDEINNGYKIEEIVAIVFEKKDIGSLPGYGYPGTRVEKYERQCDQ